MLENVISGGQTGVDQVALAVAMRFGIPTGGYMPRGFLTEDGPRPDLAERYGLEEIGVADYAIRTRLNVEESDVTLWIGGTGSPGYRCTLAACEKYRKRMFECVNSAANVPLIADFLRECRVLNVAGNRMSVNPKSAELAAEVLPLLFKALGFVERL